MITLYDASFYKRDENTVLTIGSFDGIHLGHVKVLKRIIQKAKFLNLPSMVLTFFPHPRTVLGKGSNLAMLNSIEEKKQLLASLGLDYLVIHPFTKELSELHPKKYVKEILVDNLHAKKIFIGYDHRFGKNGAAGFFDLRKFGVAFGFEVEQIAVQKMNDNTISSTSIRNLIKLGKIDQANKYLGYQYKLSGKIEYLKKTKPFTETTTICLEISDLNKLIPKHGCYKIMTAVDNQIYFGVLKIQPTISVVNTKNRIELQLLNLSSNIANKYLTINIINRLDPVNPNASFLKNLQMEMEMFVKKETLIALDFSSKLENKQEAAL